MRSTIRTVIVTLITAILIQSTSALVAPAVAWSAEAKVTKFVPEIAESDPLTAAQETQNKGSNWWKWALGILVVGGAVAAAAGGGGGGGGGSSSGNTGVSVGW